MKPRELTVTESCERQAMRMRIQTHLLEVGQRFKNESRCEPTRNGHLQGVSLVRTFSNA